MIAQRQIDFDTLARRSDPQTSKDAAERIAPKLSQRRAECYAYIVKHPGVILAFTVGKQQMQFPCDAFLTWPENLRAIALALEALRKVDRYGVTKQGEQYAGWKALPPPNGDHWTPEAARQFIDSIIGAGRVGLIGISASIREAEMVTHPDKGGHPSDFNKVQQARKLLLGTN